MSPSSTRCHPKSSRAKRRSTLVKAQPMKEEFPVMHPGQLARNPALGLLLQLGHYDSCGATDLAKCKVLGLLVLFMYKETMQECVSEFISFITSEVSDKCKREKCKTSNGDDLLWAMATLGFEEYIEPLKVYLQKYREVAILGEPRVLYGEAKQQLTTPTCNSR